MIVILQRLYAVISYRSCHPLVFVKLNTTKVWIWETNILLLVGFRKSKRK
jgi:hypothetical protein